MKIGIFDSGNGGLSVLHEAYHRLENQEYIYYADTQHVPYGLKTEEEIRGYVDEIVSFLIEKGADAIVIACNTATSVAASMVREKYDIPILGMEPAVKPAVEDNGDEDKRILVMATPVTLREKKLKDLLSRVDVEHKVDLIEMHELVNFAENEDYDSPKLRQYMEERFSTIEKDRYAYLVLGCTHFNYFKPMYKEMLSEKIQLIDGNLGTIKHLADVLNIRFKPNDDLKLKFDAPQDIVVGQGTTYYDSGDEITDNNRLLKTARMLNRLEYVRSLK